MSRRRFGAPETFLQLAREILWPQKRLWLVLHVAAMLIGLDYWLSSFWFEPDTPLDLLAMYRPEGDTQYVTLVASLARGQFGESALYESAGTGLQAFPLGSMAIHLLCVALFGTAGHVLADGIATLFYYLSLALLLVSVGLPKSYARIGALLTASGLVVQAVNWCASKSLIPSVQLLYWGRRLPRPEVSEIPLLLTIALSCALVRFVDAREGKWGWVMWGASLAWLVQGDVHGAAGIGFFSGPVLLVAALRVKGWRAGALRVCTAFGALIVFLLPFLVQNLLTPFEVTRRWGAFPLSRLHPPSQLEADWPRVLQALALVWVGFGIRKTFERSSLMRSPWASPASGALGQALLLTGLGLVAWVMMPAFVIFTGQGLQLYHFPDRFSRFISYVILIALLLISEVLLRAIFSWTRSFVRPKSQETLPLIVGLVCSCCVMNALVAEHTVSYGPPRGGFPGTGAYKKDFIELTRRLQSKEFAHARVLGTFDHATMLWWVGFKPGFLLTPDPFLTSRPDAELEERFVALAKEVQVSKHHFESMVKNATSHIFYLSCAKYNASPLYKLQPDSDYTKHQLSAISGAYLLSGFNIQVPRSVVQRLTKLYEGPRESWDHYKMPDVIVTNRHDQVYGHSPDPDVYERRLQNSTFDLWSRRLPQ